MALPLALPSIELDIEAQIIPEAQPARIATLPTTNIAIPQQPTTIDTALPDVGGDNATDTQSASNATPRATNSAFPQRPTTADPALPNVPNVDPDSITVTGTQPARIAIPPTASTAIPQQPTRADPQRQATNTHQRPNDNAAAQQIADNLQVQKDENHGDSSDGLWSLYLAEAEKQDAEVTESWKGDTDGILVFTGLFSATVASFLIESYQNLSPDSGDTTNALLTQISQQLVNISIGTPLTSVTAQSSRPFKPTASAVRVNVYWFLSLILSLNCALSATLMQQWTRRYRELAQRRVSFHKRGRMRAYIFDGIDRFGMARAVATMPTLLHISVFLFFIGLVEFLFPVYAIVAYATLGCIMAFMLVYATLTILPNICLNCPYATPLSGFTWRIFQLSAIGCFWIILKAESLYRVSMSKFRNLADQYVPEPDGLKTWRDTLKNQLKIRRQWFLQGMRKSVELCAFRADSTVVTSALVWTLTALDEDREIEHFAAKVPGFFDSRVVPDATLAVLPLMSHQPNTEPILGSRLCDLLKTCVPEASILDEKMRKTRLRVCMKCLWSFAKAYNQQPGSSQLFPPYFLNTFVSPEITRRIQAEEDSGARIIGRCFGALIVNKLAPNLESSASPIGDGELACLSAILGIESHDTRHLLSQPGAIALANMVSLTFDEAGGLISDPVPSGVASVVQQTLCIFSQAVLLEENDEVQLDQPITIISGSNGEFERILVSRLLDLLNACMRETSPITEDARTICLRTCLKGLWYFAFNRLGNSVPSYICIALTNPEMTRRIREENLTIHMMGHCVQTLVVNELMANISSRDVLVSTDELACLSAILGTKIDVKLLLSHPGAIEFMNMLLFSLGTSYPIYGGPVPSHVLDMIQQTSSALSSALSHALPHTLNIEMRRNETESIMSISDATSSLIAEIRRNILCLWNFAREYNECGNLEPLPSFVSIVFTNPETACHIRKHRDLVVRVIGHCVGSLVVNKLTADINSRDVPVGNDELVCLSSFLSTETDDVELLLSYPGAIEFTHMLLFSLGIPYPIFGGPVPSYVLDVIQQTSSALSHALPHTLNTEIRRNQTDTIMNISDGTSSLMAEIRRNILRLWDFARGYNECGNLEPLPSYVSIAFNPKMALRIRNHSDLVVRVIGHCVEVLVVNKLTSDIDSRDVPVSTDELACLSALLGIKSDDLELLLNHPCAVEFTNMLLFSPGHPYPIFGDPVPSYVLDVIQQTSSALSRSLPHQLNTEMQQNQTQSMMNIFDGASLLTVEIRRNILRVWDFARAYNERGNLEHLPSYVSIAFANPKMTQHIREHRDFVVRVIGHCVEALVVNKLAADISSHNVPVSTDKLACLSAVLGTEIEYVKLLLSHPGAIEFTNMLLFSLGIPCPIFGDTVPSYVLDVFQQTSRTLSHALPHTLNTEMRQNEMESIMNISDGTSPLEAQIRRNALRVWDLAREYSERGNSASFPSYVNVTFTNPEMTHRIRKQCDLVVRVVGHCVEALVVNKLTADINSRDISASTDELTYLSTILHTQKHDLSLCLAQHGTIELVNLASLAFGDVCSFRADKMPPSTRSVLQKTIAVLSETLPAQGNDELPQDQAIALATLSDEWYERTIASRFDGLLKVCMPGTLSLMDDVRTSCLRMCLETLWRWAKSYSKSYDQLPSYFPLVLARPEIIRLLQTEQDPTARVIGYCFGGMIVCQLVTALDSPIISLSDCVLNAEFACISAILGIEDSGASFSPPKLHHINLRNVVSLTSREMNKFTAAGMPADVLKIVQDTLYILAISFLPLTSSSSSPPPSSSPSSSPPSSPPPSSSSPTPPPLPTPSPLSSPSSFPLSPLPSDLELPLPEDQFRSLQDEYSDIFQLICSDQFKNQTLNTLYRLQQVLEGPLPAVE